MITITNKKKHIYEKLNYISIHKKRNRRFNLNYKNKKSKKLNATRNQMTKLLRCFFVDR